MPPTARRRVFLDSNVIFSGLYSSHGEPGVILERFIEGRLAVVISQQVLEEVVRTVNEKLPEALPALHRLLVGAPPEIVSDPVPQEVAGYADVLSLGDAAILAAAIAAQPDYLVTGDKHFLDSPAIAEWSGLRIVAPAELLRLLESA